jgi:hypothetical protein
MPTEVMSAGVMLAPIFGGPASGERSWGKLTIATSLRGHVLTVVSVGNAMGYLRHQERPWRICARYRVASSRAIA